MVKNCLDEVKYLKHALTIMMPFFNRQKIPNNFKVKIPPSRIPSRFAK